MNKMRLTTKLLVNNNVRNYVKELDNKIYNGISNLIRYVADNYGKTEVIHLLQHKKILDVGYKKIYKSVFKPNDIKTKSDIDKVKNLLKDIKSAQDALEHVKRINRIYTANIDRILELFTSDTYSDLYIDVFNIDELKCIGLSLLDAFPAEYYPYTSSSKRKICEFKTQEEVVNKLYEIVNVISKDEAKIIPSLYELPQINDNEKPYLEYIPDYKIRITDLYDPKSLYILNRFIPSVVYSKLQNISQYYFYNGRNHGMFKPSNYMVNLELLIGLLFDVLGEYRLALSYSRNINTVISNSNYTFKDKRPLVWVISEHNKAIINILNSMNLEIKQFDGKVYEDTSTNKLYTIVDLLVWDSFNCNNVNNNDLYIILVENKSLDNDNRVDEFKCVNAIKFKNNFKLAENVTLLPEVKDYINKYSKYFYKKTIK